MRHRRAISVGLAVVGLTLLWIWAYLTAWHHRTPVGLLCVLVVLALWQLILRYRLKGAPLSEVEEVPASDQTRLSVLRDVLAGAAGLSAERYTGEVFADYAVMLLDPPVFRKRTVERLSLGREIINRELTVYLSFEQAQAFAKNKPSGTVVVPLLAPPKGRGYVLARIENETGTRISPLNTREALEVNVALLLHLYRDAYDLDYDLTLWDDYPYTHNFLDMVALICSDAAPPAGSTLISNVLNRIPIAPAKEAAGQRLQHVVTLLAARYVVPVVLEVGTSTTLTFQTQIATKSRTIPVPQDYSTRVTRWLQRWFHVPSGYLRLPLAQARRCESYHLYIELPNSSHPGPVAVKRDTSEVRLVGGQGLAVGESSLDIAKSQRSLLHAYGRNLRSLPGGVQIEGRFYERPYGTELYAVLAALAYLGLAIVFRESFLDGREVDPGAVLVGVPVGLATFIGVFSRAYQSSITVSPAGITGGVIAGVLSVIVVVGYLLEQANGSLGAGNYTGNVFWDCAVAFGAVLNAASSGIFLLRFIRYVQAG